MSCVIDHLSSDYRVTVRQAFTDARGVPHAVGESGIIRRIELDWPRQEIAIEWERDGAAERMVFALAAREGPGNGRMRAYFDRGEWSPVPRPPPAQRPRQAPEIPELVAEPVTDPSRYDEAFRRVWALAARGQFAAAESQLQVILSAPDPWGGTLERAADDLVGLACAHALDPDPAVYPWLRERAVRLWYAWGSQATSGGEGAARMDSIRSAEARLAACDAQRG